MLPSSMQSNQSMQSTRKRPRSFRSTFVLIAMTGVLLALPVQAQSAKVFGIDIVPWSKKIGVGRYKSGRTFDKTVKFFRDNFRGSRRVKWHAEVNLPRVKYKHLQNLSPKRKWDGVNLYEIKNTVYIYVLKHEPDAADASGTKKGKKSTAVVDVDAIEAAFASAKGVDLDELAALLGGADGLTAHAPVAAP